jgi:ammonia channel protein AmtB
MYCKIIFFLIILEISYIFLYIHLKYHNLFTLSMLSILIFVFLQPIIQKRFRIHDTCGVHNLHGMPGVLAALFGALMSILATETSYDYSLYEVYNYLLNHIVVLVINSYIYTIGRYGCLYRVPISFRLFFCIL